LQQFDRAERTTTRWISEVQHALDSTYFGTTTGQVVDFINSSASAATQEPGNSKYCS
jgi:hypothetical protein